jgi:ubiquinone/menaquinone biosynthesis C-methylase UbiE
MPAAKAYKGVGMEGSLARWYDRTTRKDMPGIVELANRISLLVPAGGSVLEVAPGPGFLSIELARRGFNLHAVDISQTFVAIARRNAAAAGVTVKFERGNAAALPAGEASVDFVVCRAAFKNFAEPVKALREMLRVLKADGMALLIDMRRDVPMAEIRKYVARLGVGWLNRQFMLFTFRNMLIRRAYPLAEIQRMAEEAGWRGMKIETAPLGFEAWMSRPRPI